MTRTRRFDLNVSVFVVVMRGSQVLLLRRSNTGWHDDYYSLPAGGHDGGETLVQAAARELREETGLNARGRCSERDRHVRFWEFQRLLYGLVGGS
jgi:8-oxo-dGTP pyrophosphatase MutT (NUDIX family)